MPGLRATAKALLPARAVHAWRVLLHTKLRLFEPEYRLAEQFLSGDKVAVDVGANVGLYADLFSKRARSVVAFEPHPRCAAHLRKLALPRCEVIEAAVSDMPGRLTLRVPIVGGGEAAALGSIDRANDFGGADAVAHEVEVTTLDAALEGRGSVGFIKIDGEGHELAVVRGAEAIIGRDRPVFLIEMEARHGADIAAMFDFFAVRNYRALAAADGARLTPISAGELLAMQTPERLERKLREPRWTGYVHNVFFLPGG